MQGENYTVCKYFSKLYYSKSHVFKDIRIMIYKFNMNWNYTVGFDTYSLKKEEKMKDQLRLLTFTVIFSLMNTVFTINLIYTNGQRNI